MSDVGIVMTELDFVTQHISSGFVLGPTLTLLVLKSILDLVSLKKLSPRMRGSGNDDTAIAGIGHIIRSKTIST